MFNASKVTKEKVREMIENGDDSHHNQIRIKKDGTVYLSDIVGNQKTDGLLVRFETFDAGNDYVGKKAAKDDKHIDTLYKMIKWSWIKQYPGYLDYLPDDAINIE